MDSLRQHLIELLTGENAHVGFEKATKGLPENLQGAKPAGIEHSAWELLEHLRIAQRDILEFSRDPKHVSPEFPRDTGPKSPHRPTQGHGIEASPNSSVM